MLLSAGLNAHVFITGILSRSTRNAVVDEVNIVVEDKEDSNPSNVLNESKPEVYLEKCLYSEDDSSADVKNTEESNTFLSKDTKDIMNHSRRPVQKGKKNWIDQWKFMTKPSYLMLCSVSFTLNSGTYMAVTHFPAYFKEHGRSEEEIGSLWIVYGACNVLCRLLTGAATSGKDFDMMAVSIGSCGIMTCLMLLCPVMVTSYYGQIIFCVVLGSYGNMFYSLIAPIAIEIVGTEDMVLAFGVEVFLGGFGCLCGPPFAGRFGNRLINILQFSNILYIP